MSYYPVAGTPQLVSGSDGALHVFCRSHGGQIIHHFPSPAGGWRRRNLSAGFGPPANIYDDPSVWIGHNPDRLRIYGRNSAGCLIEYSRDPGEEWRVSNLTHQAGIGEAYRIAGRPIVVEGAGAMRRLLARNRDGDLVEYVLSDVQQWNASNLTTVNQLLVGHRFVGNPTTAVGYGGSLHVFVRSLSGDPVRYFWYAGSGWRCEYLAPRPGAGRFVGTPAVLAGPGPVLRLFTVGPNGDLLLYLREPGRPWQIQNMAPQIGAGIAAEGLAPPLYRSQPVRAWQW